MPVCLGVVVMEAKQGKVGLQKARIESGQLVLSASMWPKLSLV